MADKDRFDEDSLYDKRKAFDNEEYAKELAADEYDTGRAADMAPDNRYLMSTRNRSIEAGAGVGWLAIVFFRSLPCSFSRLSWALPGLSSAIWLTGKAQKRWVPGRSGSGWQRSSSDLLHHFFKINIEKRAFC
ncbi:hypothetical protein QS257_08875 [Terrilactibacillus sp. S3-3]|nr:hypothetical protein QS257_08875 [Terrilactibacillus sp. S3-3]